MQTDEPNIFAAHDSKENVAHVVRDEAVLAVRQELNRADKWGPFHSMHDAFAHLHEEFDELKAHVWTKQRDRDMKAMRAEAVQVAAMAIKAIEVIDTGRGRI